MKIKLKVPHQAAPSNKREHDPDELPSMKGMALVVIMIAIVKFLPYEQAVTNSCFSGVAVRELALASPLQIPVKEDTSCKVAKGQHECYLSAVRQDDQVKVSIRPTAKNANETNFVDACPRDQECLLNLSWSRGMCPTPRATSYPAALSPLITSSL